MPTTLGNGENVCMSCVKKKIRASDGEDLGLSAGFGTKVNVALNHIGEQFFKAQYDGVKLRNESNVLYQSGKSAEAETGAPLPHLPLYRNRYHNPTTITTIVTVITH